jgi:hypothetical protein
MYLDYNCSENTHTSKIGWKKQETKNANDLHHLTIDSGPPCDLETVLRDDTVESVLFLRDDIGGLDNPRCKLSKLTHFTQDSRL